MRTHHLYPIATLLGAILWVQPASTAPSSNPKGAVALGIDSKPKSLRKDPAVAVIEQWVLGLSQATLENGLRVVMAPDPESPTVSIALTYDVGSRNEGAGQSGFAHLFEHLMFQGSRNVAKGEHFQMVTARGGQLNGTTSSDRTNYFETLPANELELGLWLEADRMRWLDISVENFENQRSVVKEEYRMRVENAAYHPALIELERLVFAGYQPYDHPTIGSMADLDAAKVEWVRDFHSRYYRPNNAVLALSGGFDPDQAIELVRKHFGAAERGPTPTFVEPALPPQRTTESALSVLDTNAKTPALLFGWRIPTSRTKDHFALEMTARVLADGESSILYELLVRKKALARDVSVFTYDHRGPDAFVVMVELTEQANISQVESLVNAELQKLATQGPGDAILARARQRTKSAFVFGLQSNQSRATTLGEYTVFFGNPRLIARDLEALLQVDPQSVKAAVLKYLSKESRSFVTVKPTAVQAQPPLAKPNTDERTQATNGTAPAKETH
jgi:predicted Zn-dependent peptidase